MVSMGIILIMDRLLPSGNSLKSTHQAFSALNPTTSPTCALAGLVEQYPSTATTPIAQLARKFTRIAEVWSSRWSRGCSKREPITWGRWWLRCKRSRLRHFNQFKTEESVSFRTSSWMGSRKNMQTWSTQSTTAGRLSRWMEIWLNSSTGDSKSPIQNYKESSLKWLSTSREKSKELQPQPFASRKKFLNSIWREPKWWLYKQRNQ